MRRRPTDPGSFPIQKPESDAAKEAAKLHADWCDQFAHVEQLEVDHGAAREAAQEKDLALQAALAEAERTGKRTQATEKAEQAFIDAKHVWDDTPWEHRAAAASREAENCRSAFCDFLNAHFDELVDEPELADEAEAAQQGILDAAQAIVGSVERWEASSAAYGSLISHAASIDGQAESRLAGSVHDLSQAATNLLDNQDAAAKPMGRGGVLGGQPIPSPVPANRHLRERRERQDEEKAINGDSVTAN